MKGIFASQNKQYAVVVGNEHPVKLLRPRTHMLYTVVISEYINKGGSRHNQANFWVWLRCDRAHIVKDGNMIIHFNTDKV